MGTEFEIALVLGMAFLWVMGTFAILSAIDRAERKARRLERRADRAARRHDPSRPTRGSRLVGVARRPRARRLHPH